MSPWSRSQELIFFVAMMSSAIALGAALAHLLELPNKIGLSRDAYFTVQLAYRGWDRLAWLLLVELGSIVALAILCRHDPRVLPALVAAAVFLLLAQAVFWTFTYPANVATSNWTVAPDDWERLRARWEYSHAAGAVFQLLVVAALTVAILRRS